MKNRKTFFIRHMLSMLCAMLLAGLLLPVSVSADDKQYSVDSADFRITFNDSGDKSPDIAALAADYAALHLIIGKGNDADRSLRHVVSRAALDSGGDDVDGPSIRLGLGLGLYIADQKRRVVAGFLLGVVEYDGLGFVARHGGDALQFALLLFEELLRGDLELIDLLRALIQLFLTLFDAFELLVEAFFPLLEAPFGALDFVPALLVFALLFSLYAINLFLCFEYGFFLKGLGALLRIVDHSLYRILRLGRFGLRDVPSVIITYHCPDAASDKDAREDQQIMPPVQNSFPPIYIICRPDQPILTQDIDILIYYNVKTPFRQ